MIYRSSFLPWESPAALGIGDVVSIRLRADYTGTDYLWSWASNVSSADSSRPEVRFQQSTFWGAPIPAMRLSRRGGGYRPSLGANGTVDAWILSQMNGASSLEEIARGVMERFPERFRSLGEALTHAGNLSDTYGSKGGSEGSTPES